MKASRRCGVDSVDRSIRTLAAIKTHSRAVGQESSGRFNDNRGEGSAKPQRQLRIQRAHGEIITNTTLVYLPGRLECEGFS